MPVELFERISFQLGTRLTLSQLGSLKIHRTSFLNFIKFANILIFKLQNFEGAGWEVFLGTARISFCASLLHKTVERRIALKKCVVIGFQQ